MDQIQHRHIQIRGLNLHLAEIGSGSRGVVVLLHGFPEIWYTWRNQMLGLADAGFRAIAPDFRGYGLSDKPSKPEASTFSDLVDDLLGIIDHLAIPKIFLVSKDFGTKVASLFALVHSERVLGLITTGVPYAPPGPSSILSKLPKGCYISLWQVHTASCLLTSLNLGGQQQQTKKTMIPKIIRGRLKWMVIQEPGRAEADFGRFDAKTIVRKVYILFSRSDMPIAGENQEILDLVGASTPLPPWLSEEDLAYYGSLYETSGFQTALQVPYRSLHEAFEIPDPVLKVPAVAIMGMEDYSWRFPGVKEYIESGKVKEYVPDLEIRYLPEGTHFSPEQFPEEVNKMIVEFLAKHA